MKTFKMLIKGVKIRMTIKELIEELQRYPENIPVFVDGNEPTVRYNDEFPLDDPADPLCEYCCAIELM